MVRQVIHAQSTKGHLHARNAQMRDGQTGQSCSINKRSHTTWKCTNERWSDRSFMPNGHIQSGNAQTRQDGQAGHLCSINKRSHTA